jgi:hypothetical protein
MKLSEGEQKSTRSRAKLYLSQNTVAQTVWGPDEAETQLYVSFFFTAQPRIIELILYLEAI